MADLKFEIIKKIGVLSETEKGWKKEINLVKWNAFSHSCVVFVPVTKIIFWCKIK